MAIPAVVPCFSVAPVCFVIRTLGLPLGRVPLTRLIFAQNDMLQSAKRLPRHAFQPVPCMIALTWTLCAITLTESIYKARPVFPLSLLFIPDQQVKSRLFALVLRLSFEQILGPHTSASASPPTRKLSAVHLSCGSHYPTAPSLVGFVHPFRASNCTIALCLVSLGSSTPTLY